MISYENISKALASYKALGYTYIDVPWIVDNDSIDSTKPSDRKSISIAENAHLVGSAEQSFYHMIKNELLQHGKYVAATPCFRDENVIDELHKNYFFKVELINYTPDVPSSTDVFTITEHALFVFNKLKRKVRFEREHTHEGFDINVNGVEIGSYGVRQINGHNWVYGTGIAEPRFSLVTNGKQ